LVAELRNNDAAVEAEIHAGYGYETPETGWSFCRLQPTSGRPADWLEACVARDTICNAGELNGHLKLATPLFTPPLPLSEGAIRLPPGYRHEVDRRTFERFTIVAERFAATEVAGTAQ